MTTPRSPAMSDIVTARLSRRALLAGAASAGLIAGLAPAEAQTTPPASRFDFREIAAGLDDRDLVAEGYQVQVVMRWGDPVLPGAPDFNPAAQTAASQLMHT